MIIRDLGLTEYNQVWGQMFDFTKTRNINTPDEIWVCEHLPVFTVGKTVKNFRSHIDGIPCIPTDRGGKITYHGPGQLVCYPLIDLKRSNIYPKELLKRIEELTLSFLSSFGIKGQLVPSAPGVYLNLPGGSEPFTNLAKISSVGLKISNFHSYHGFSINICMDLRPFRFIDPCGYSNLRVVNLEDFVPGVTIENSKRTLTKKLKDYFCESLK